MDCNTLNVASLKPYQENPVGQNHDEGKRVQHVLLPLMWTSVKVFQPTHLNLMRELLERAGRKCLSK